jgi:hypothetical protein
MPNALNTPVLKSMSTIFFFLQKAVANMACVWGEGGRFNSGEFVRGQRHLLISPGISPPPTPEFWAVTGRANDRPRDEQKQSRIKLTYGLYADMDTDIRYSVLFVIFYNCYSTPGRYSNLF